MKNIDYKWFIIIGLSVVITIVTVLFLNRQDKFKDKYEKQIAVLNDSIHKKEGKLAIYKIHEKELVDQIIVREQEIISLNKYIKRLKKNNYEKADSISKLDNRNTILYSTEWLSKRSNTK